ncbi:hypothetical protein OG948_60565 (plasmid) [Embleya sp. NBC_00888]|uniref:hypothetical protein n=1 Tax=Embleya sp. NBC_00888 TaxID=2975960 RepID=UPI002F9082C0|nr:hypothetical protein OG948_60565 [Embleya sp. NBC_00888]
MSPRTGVRPNGTVSQRWLSDHSDVPVHVLQALRHRGLLPGLDALRPEDVVVARAAEATGAHRTSLESASEREHDLTVVRTVRDAMTKKRSPRTLLLVTSNSAVITSEEHEFLAAKERPRRNGESFVVLPLGVWMAELDAILEPHAAARGGSIAA